MKFDFGETFGEYCNRVNKWHKWFAWYPVELKSHDIRWLETVERRIVWEHSYAGDIWREFYREIK